MPQRPLPSRTRRAAVAGLAAASLVVPTVATTTAAQADPFAGGSTVDQDKIKGDGAPAARSTGSAQLTDGVGLEWFINDDIVGSTASSASGAASEASFASPVAASTELGGTTASTLSDAFDGYNTLSTFVGPGAPTGELSLPTPGVANYSGLGPALAPTCNGRQLNFPTQLNGAVAVSRHVYVPDNAGYARWTNTVTNTGPAATAVTLYITNNLGSDSGTEIFGSSNGDLTASTADTWIGSFQAFSGGTSGDPRLGHVLQGNGASGSLAEVSFADGDDNPYWTYQVTLAPGQTKSIVNYALGRGFKSQVATDAAALAAAPPVVCMTPAEQRQAVNFRFDRVAPVLSVAPVTRLTSGSSAAVTYTPSAVDDVDGTIPVICAPPSGTVFPLGTTTVTCTATDSSGNVAVRTFPVTVAPVALKLSKIKIKKGAVKFTVSSVASAKVTMSKVGSKGKVGKQRFAIKKAGKVSQKLKGKLKVSKLSPGRYTVKVKVRNTAGAKRAKRATLIIKR